MSFERYIFCEFDDGGVVSSRSGRLWVLNRTAAAAWCLAQVTRSGCELTRAYADLFSIDENRAWQDLCSIQDTFAEIYARQTEVGCIDELSIQHHQSWSKKFLKNPLNHSCQLKLEIYGLILEIRCEQPHIVEEFTVLFSHFVCDSNREPSCRLTLVKNADALWKIYQGENLFFERLTSDEVLPCLFTLVFVQCMEQLSHRLLFHAAVIGHRGDSILMPAHAGCGKSTLSAALLANGFTYYSDELAVIDIHTLEVFACALPLSIKSGSIEPLVSYYPGLSLQKEYLRADEKIIRYLKPPSSGTAEKGIGAAVKALVFPRFSSQFSTRLIQLNKKDALQQLAEQGSSNRDLSSADIQAMIRLVEERPCYSLEFSDLEEATRLIRPLFSNESLTIEQ